MRYNGILLRSRGALTFMIRINQGCPVVNRSLHVVRPGNGLKSLSQKSSMEPSFVAVTYYVTGCILIETSVSYIFGNNDDYRTAKSFWDGL